jgi:hypothetical protein
MKTTELTVELPEDAAYILRTYASEHAMSLAELLSRYARRLQTAAQRGPHPKNLQFTGTVPADVEVREDYRRHVENKHR